MTILQPTLFQAHRTWWLIWLAAFVFVSPAYSLSVSRGPYLQLGTPTSVVVRWRTTSASNTRVRYGTNVSSLTILADSLAVTNEHEIAVSNLLPNTKYFYSVGTTTTVLSGGNTNYFFTTPPVSGTSKAVRIWVIGDAGKANNDQESVRDAYYALAAAESRSTDLWLMLGDNAYEVGSDGDYQDGVFDMYTNLLRNSVVWPTLGNHDTAFFTNYHDLYPYFSIFTLPKSGEAGGYASGTEHYYSFDYANIHFICLDSMTASRATNGAMATWLRSDLDSTTNQWLVAFWHHPPYSKGSHDSDLETELMDMRQNFLPILEAGGVDLVLAGHSHSYERSFLLDGHYGLSSTLTNRMLLNTNSGRVDERGPYLKSPQFVSRQGAVYAVVGSSGEVVNAPLNHRAMFISMAELGSLVLDINTNRLDARFLRESGSIDDYFTIVKDDVCFSDARLLSGNGGFQATLTNIAAGKTNIILASSNLTSWIAISTNIISSNSFKFIEPGPATNRARFYRVLRQP